MSNTILEPLDSKTYILEHKVQIQSFTLPECLKINKDSQFEALWNLKPTEREPLLIFGKLIQTPRYVRQYLRDYKFSNIVHKGYSLDSNNPAENYILELLKYVNYISGKTYNGILVNWYTDGNEYIGYHSDDESELSLMDKLTVLAGVRAFPARVKCATLAWHTLEAALNRDNTTIKTE